MAPDPARDAPGALLAVQGLTVRYGPALAVEDVSLAVRPGEIVTLVGPNGAGKTTALAALMGLRPCRGGIRFAGAALQGRAVAARVARRLALVPETRELFASMTVRENLILGAYARTGAFARPGSPALADDLARVHALFPRLAERSRQQAGTLSGGERQMLAIGRALMARPRLLMLDEPSLGLAPLIVREIFAIVARLRDEGVAVLLVEQNAAAALHLADYAYVLESGRIALHGPAAALAADRRIAETYLGVTPSSSPPCTPSSTPLERSPVP